MDWLYRRWTEPIVHGNLIDLNDIEFLCKNKHLDSIDPEVLKEYDGMFWKKCEGGPKRTSRGIILDLLLHS